MDYTLTPPVEVTCLGICREVQIKGCGSLGRLRKTPEEIIAHNADGWPVAFGKTWEDAAEARIHDHYAEIAARANGWIIGNGWIYHAATWGPLLKRSRYQTGLPGQPDSRVYDGWTACCAGEGIAVSIP